MFLSFRFCLFSLFSVSDAVPMACSAGHCEIPFRRIKKTSSNTGKSSNVHNGPEDDVRSFFPPSSRDGPRTRPSSSVVVDLLSETCVGFSCSQGPSSGPLLLSLYHPSLSCHRRPIMTRDGCS
ncbi:hypothetical protein LZ30DRAFT_710636 [Colletotrichum cereale]|nr:hypothetical protein LZ30DRAFT_710636 [Colletotrichum cereale]